MTKDELRALAAKLRRQARETSGPSAAVLLALAGQATLKAEERAS